jgi:hypothetical protein
MPEQRDWVAWQYDGVFNEPVYLVRDGQETAVGILSPMYNPFDGPWYQLPHRELVAQIDDSVYLIDVDAMRIAPVVDAVGYFILPPEAYAEKALAAWEEERAEGAASDGGAWIDPKDDAA